MIHLIKIDGKFDKISITACRLEGKQFNPGEYKNKKGGFRAVLASDMHQGPTCPDCKLACHAKRTDRTNMRVL